MKGRGSSSVVSWAMALGLAAGAAGCVENSAGPQSATETAKADRHVLREGRELREVRVTEATAAKPASPDRHFSRSGRELTELRAGAPVEAAKPGAVGVTPKPEGAPGALAVTPEGYEGR